LLRTLLVLFLALWPGGRFCRAQDVWSGVERIVAVGDVHGDLNQFHTLLREAGVIDQRDRWSGGRTHLVQVGDVPDRGPDTRKIMDLLMRLESQARKAGGNVHALIGNHEAMNLYGDLRYVTSEEFDAFRTGASEQVREAFFEQHVEELKRNPPAQGLPEFDAAYRKKWNHEHPLGYFEHRLNFGPNGRYGRWIRGHNAVVKINDTLFLHGGISPKYAAMSAEQINAAVRAELSDFAKLEGGLTLDQEGPLWYRGLAQEDEAALAPHVEALLRSHKAQRIVVGHTPTPGAVLPRFQGRVVAIDVGLSKAYGARRACLILEQGRPYALHRGKKLPLPADSGAGLLAYLREAAALDPPPSPLGALLKRMEEVAPAGATR
jgi:Calcineurin-like phosphoesterase.